MSVPQDIQRRMSIAKLTVSPSQRQASLFGSNARFLSRESAPEDNLLAASPEPEHENLAAGLRDPRLLDLVSRHLRADNPLAAEGADITRDLYYLSSEARPPARRARSWSLADLQQTQRRGSSASLLNVPGGFRRQFVLARAHKRPPTLLTKNFVEFLSIYGHFAGEALEDSDDVACHYSAVSPFAKDSDTAPLLEGSKFVNPAGTATDTKAYFLLLKAFVGTGVLFLPRAFASGGLVFSAVTLLAFGLLSFWCYLILIYARAAAHAAGFAETGYKYYGRWLQQLILLSIVLSQIGFAAAYIVFTAENLRAFAANVLHLRPASIDIFWPILLQAVVLSPVALIRDITKLSFLALMANAFILLGLATILYYTISELAANNLVPGSNVYYLFNPSEFSLFVGVAIFTFEGVGLIIPIHDSMIYPRHFPGVLFSVMATISLLFVFIGAVGYFTFGDAINTVILLNLPQNSPLVVMIQLLYAIAILLSTPLQIFPAVRLIELKLFSSTISGRTSVVVKWQKNLIRIVFVALTATIALYAGKNLDRLVSFIGCFACIPLVYMYPPMLFLKGCCDYRKDPYSWSKFWLAISCYVVIALGAVAMVYTTYDILAH